MGGIRLRAVVGLWTWLSLAGGPVAAATFTVTSTADSGAGTLRQALLDAEASGGADTIAFNLAGSGVHTIAALAVLVCNGADTTIDGTTQPGYAGTPLVEIDATTAMVPGLLVTAANCTVRGLCVHRAPYGVQALGAASGLTVQGCYLGVDPTGYASSGLCGYGVYTEASATIGGAGAGDGNLISGCSMAGLYLAGTDTSFVVEGNRIGTDASGTAPLPNVMAGVAVTGWNVRAWIGGATAGSANTIAYNAGPGIGLVALATVTLGRNNLAHNTGLGFDLGVDGATPNDSGDPDVGPNGFLNKPVLLSAALTGAALVVRGFTRPGTTVDLYRAQPHPSGFGDGAVYLGTATEGSAADGDATAGSYSGLVNGLNQGNDTTNRFRFDFATPPGLAPGDPLTAVATDAGGNTSEFSGIVTLAGPAAQLVFTSQPANLTAGGLFNPAVQVEVRDSAGRVTLYDGDVNLALVGYGPADLVGTTAASALTGVATFTGLGVTRAGQNHTLRASSGPLTPVNSALFDVAVGPLSADATTATVPAGQVGLATNLTVQTRDAYGNPLATGGATVTIEITGANPGTPAVTDHADGTYTASYTPTVTGTDTIYISVNGPKLGASPFTSLVSPGPATAASTTATVPNGQPGQPTTILVTTRDAQGNACAVGGATVTVEVAGANAATVAAADLGNGTYQAVYTPTNLGTDQVTIKVNGTATGGSPYLSQVTVGPASPVTTTAQVPAGTAGAVTTITVTARDGSGTPRGVGGDTVTVTVSGANSATPAVTDLGDGTYTASYTPTITGADQVAVTINGAALAGSPYASLVSPGPSHAATSTAAIPGGTAGAAAVFTIQARDALGNPRTAGGDLVVVTVTGANNGTPPVTDLGNGTYAATFTSTASGTEQVAVTLNGSALGGSPFARAVAPGATSGAHGSASVGAGLAGAATTITVTARDAQGNPRGVGGDTVALQVSGANPGTPPVLDQGNGTYLAAYTPTVAGTDQVAITINGTPLASSPFASVVSPGPTVAAASTATIPAGLAGTPATFTVFARDAYGNGRATGGDAVVVTVTGANSGSPAVADAGTGVYTASFTSTVVGPEQVTVTVNGGAVAGSPFARLVGPGLASAPHCTAAAGPGTAGEPTTLTVVTRDASGNPRGTGGDLVVVQVTGANPATPPVTDLGDGTYRATYTPTRAGEDSLAVTVNGAAVGNSPLVSPVGPAAPSAARSSLAPDRTQAVANGADPVAFTLTIRDGYDNPVPGVAASRLGLTAADSTGVTIVPPAGATDATGRVTATATSTRAGEVTFTARLDSTALPGVPAVTFVAGAGFAGQSGLVADRATAVANGSDPVTLTITVRDAQGNPVAGQSAADLLVIADPAAGVTLTQPTAPTNAAGQTTATAVSTRSGTVLCSARLAGSALPQTAAVVFTPGPPTTDTSQLAADRAAVTANGTAAVTLTATVRDAQGNPVPGLGPGAVVVTLLAGTAVQLTQPSLPTNAAGQATATATTTAAQSLRFGLRVEGQDAAATVQVEALAGPPHHLVFLTPPAPVRAGSPLQPAVRVELRDANENRAVAATTPVALALGTNPGAATLTGGAATAAVGGVATFADLRVDRSAAGYTLTASATGLPAVTSAPFDVLVGPPDPARSSLALDRSEAVADGSPVTVTILLRDALGNPVVLPAEELALTSTPAGERVSLTAPAGTDATGRTTAELRASWPGECVVQLVAGGVTCAPVTATFRPRTPDADRSGVTLSAGAVAADGGATVELRVALRDRDGQPVNGSPASARRLQVAGAVTDGTGLEVVAAGHESNAAGEFTMTLRATMRDRFTLTPVVGGVTLSSVPLDALDVLRTTLAPGRHFLGLPFTAYDPSPPAVLGPDGWRLARWDPARGAFEGYRAGADPAQFGFLPGRGLWLRADTALTLAVPGTPAGRGPCDWALQSGWNAVANPYDADLPWDLARWRVLLDGVDRGPLGDPLLWDAIRPFGWIWDSATARHRLVFGPDLPDAGATLASVPRLAGVWVQALRDGVTLRVVPASGPGGRGRAAATARDWAATLAAQCGAERAEILVGAASRLTRALPLEAPPGESGLRLAVVAGDSRLAGCLAPSTAQAAWELAVTVPAGGEVVLSWPGLLRQLPPTVRLELVDPTAGRSLVLNTSGSYRFTAAAGAERRLALTARLGAVPRAVISGFAVEPTRGRGAACRLTLSGPAEVTLTVLGLGGRVIRELREMAAAGPLTLVWDGLDAAGRPVPAGVYQVRAAAVAPGGGGSRAVRTVVVP